MGGTLRTPEMKLAGIVLDSPDPRELGSFYHRLLGWAGEQDEPGWVKLSAPDSRPGVFHSNLSPLMSALFGHRIPTINR